MTSALQNQSPSGPHRILVVEGDAAGLKATSGLLAQAGYDVVPAAEGRAALRLMRSHRPALVLLDQLLPDLPGIDVLRQIKADPEFALVSVVLFSSTPISQAQQVAWLDAGADSNISRSITPQELLARLRAELRHHELNERLRASEQQVRTIIDSAHDAFMAIDAGGRVTEWNHRAAALFGWSRPEIIGQSLSARIVPPQHRAAHDDGLRHFLATGEDPMLNRMIEITACDRSGREFPVELTIRPARHGNTWMFFAFLRDITARKRTEELMRESEARFRGLFDEAPIGYHEIDTNGRIVRINHTELQMLGYAEVEMVGRMVSDFAADPVRSAEAVRAKLAGTVSAEGAYERQIRRRDGAMLEVLVNDRLIRNGSGRVVGIRTLLQDNTARKQAEASVLKLSAATEQSPVTVVITDLCGNIEYVNPRFSATTGYSFEEVRGKNPRILKSGETSAEEYQKLWQTISAGGTWKGEFHNRRKNGEFYLEEATISPIRDATGRMTHYLAIKEDITARKQAEQELRAAKIAAENAARAKSEFLANMSHEIRTPMNGVIGMTGLLLDTDLDPEQRQFTESVRNSAENLMTVINDILDFSKIEAGKLTFEELDFDLVETIEGTLDMLAERAQAKGIELLSTVAPDVPVRLRGDPGRVRQILTNLLGNAIKFTERGEVVLRAVLENETAAHAMVRFKVTDTGIGIPPEAQKRLFQSFSQADSSTTRKYGGTGLGLAISKQLVALMHGEIGLESEAGKGSTFWFTAQFEKQTGPPRPPRDPNRNLFNLRVLVVDDNATNRQILRHQIFSWKMQKGSAAGGHEALRILRAAAAGGQPYDLALLDMQMPEMDGLTLARTIKADPAIAPVRLIMLTSLGHRFTKAELQAAGIEAYLIKPVKQSRLFDTLVDVMGGEKAGRVFTETHFTPGPRADGSASPALRVLVAEDNQVNQKVALFQLRKLGCAVDLVANGLEALEALPRVHYDLVFMDCQMPEMDGYETARAIRKRERDTEHPCRWRGPVHIIAMTANALQGDREKCLAAGMDDYVSKPMRLDELQVTLERWRLILHPPAGPAGPTPKG